MTVDEAIRRLSEIETKFAKDIKTLLQQQQQQIEQLQIREHRLTEYMRDVKNYALTLREVSQNAIDEGEVME